jgi:hypothetical protein
MRMVWQGALCCSSFQQVSCWLCNLQLYQCNLSTAELSYYKKQHAKYVGALVLYAALQWLSVLWRYPLRFDTDCLMLHL